MGPGAGLKTPVRDYIEGYTGGKLYEISNLHYFDLNYADMVDIWMLSFNLTIEQHIKLVEL